MFRKIVVSLALLTAACGPVSKLSAPDGFAHVDGTYDDRVANASGVVVGTRVVANEPKANLDFWTQAIDLRLRQKGYEPYEQPQDVKSDSGLPGRSLHYVYFDGTRKNRYFVDVYGTTPRLQLFTAEDNLTSGPTPRGGPTNRDMIELMTPKEFDAYIKMEIGTNAALVKAAGIKVN